MLAHAVEGDVADEHQFVVFLGEDFLQMPARIGMQPGKEFRIHPRDSAGGVEQPLAIRVFADRRENFANRSLDAREIDSRSSLRLIAHFAVVSSIRRNADFRNKTPSDGLPFR